VFYIQEGLNGLRNYTDMVLSLVCWLVAISYCPLQSSVLFLPLSGFLLFRSPNSFTHTHTHTHIYVFFFVALRPNAGHGLIHEVSRSHTMTHHIRYDSSGRVISLTQRPLHDNTQHSQQTDIHAPQRDSNPYFNRQAAADLRLRPRGYWHRPT
jgi:hypothetical protein